MNQEQRSRKGHSAWRAVLQGVESVKGSKGPEVIPPHGEVEMSGDLVKVHCGQCRRWIRCYEGIKPEIALDRHCSQLHEALPFHSPAGSVEQGSATTLRTRQANHILRLSRWLFRERSRAADA